jgi:phospholipid/cholesterol/gamma-HCH transport system substrate-binding protein
MPSAKKVAWAQLRVGVLAIVAMVILAALIFLITGDTSLFNPRAVLYTYLSDSAALANGANVRINGILAGKIKNIELTQETDPLKVVRVTLEVDQGKLPQIPEDSEAAISAENVLGSKYINIRKGTSTRAIKNGGTLTAQDTRDLQDVVESGYSVMESARGMLKRIDAMVSIIEKGHGSIGKLIYDEKLYANLVTTTDEAAKVAKALNSGKGTLGRLLYDDALHDDMRGSIARVNAMLDGLQQGQGTLGRLLKDPALYEEFRKTNAEIRQILADINAGKGTAGKLLKDDALHKQIEGTIAKLDQMLAAINSGQGTLGQLMVNPQMYESLNGATREMHELMKDFRRDPKKFLRIKLALF